MDGMDTGFIGNDWHFDACTFGQVGDEMCVSDVAVEFEHIAALEGIDNVRSIFIFALQVFNREWSSELLFDLVLPSGFVMLIFLQDIGILARIPAGAMRAIFFYQVRSLAKPPVVFRVVPA